MRTRLLNLVLLAALALAGSRLWLFLGEPPPVLPAITGGPPPPAATAAVEPKEAAVEPRPEEYDAIVARDLFSPTRGVVPPAPVAAAKPAAKPQPAPKLTLYGVVIIDGEKTAYLQEGTQESRPRKVREHESFAGGVVSAIRPDGVTFVFAGTESNVPLRTPKDGVAPPPRAADAVGAVPRPQAPAAVPRRQLQPGIQQGQLPVPGRPTIAQPRVPVVAPPIEPEGDVFEDEEFPEEPLPEDEDPGLMEEDAGD